MEINYKNDRWRLFRGLRAEAIEMIHPLAVNNIEALAYGSIARGDVSGDSDVDIFLPSPPISTIIESILERDGFSVVGREIVQATPSYAAKGYLHVGELRSYSFPLVEMRTLERDFYSFAGAVNTTQLEGGVRVPGVDKRLMLIEPTERGHLESPIVGREGVAAKILGVSLAVVRDRVRTLRRREKIGRTGVFLKRGLSSEEGFEEVLHELSRTRPAVRRRLRM